VDLSLNMLERARKAAPGALPVRATAEQIPFAARSFDRVFAINALHHFREPAAFVADCRRVLREKGSVMTIGLDPHTGLDQWWVYDYFPETLAIDRDRFARVRTLRGEMTLAGFSWSESFEVDRIEAVHPAGEALATGIVDRAYTSQLAVLSDEEFDAGVARMKAASEAAGGELPLVTDFYLFATVGRV